MATFAEVEDAVAALETAVAGLDAACVPPADAARLVAAFVKGERVCGAGKALCATRVADSKIWRDEGQRSPGAWLAKQAGTTITDADATIETARRMEDLAGLDEAYRCGRVSDVQAKEIASAAAGSPDAEAELLELAATDTLVGLRDACRRVKATGAADELARHRAMRARRCFRTWTDAEGMGRGELRMLPEQLAWLRGRLEPFEATIFKAARAEGRRESYDAYRLDALLTMAEAASCDGNDAPAGVAGASTTRRGPATKAIVLVDHAALVRGHAEPGERCEIAGVGPVPVAVVKEMLGDAFLAAVVTDGVDVYNVAHLGRPVTAHQRTALQVRDPECVVPGCHVRDGLEIHHTRDWCTTKKTRLEHLARPCHFHHDLITYEGYRLEGKPGDWHLMTPGGREITGGPDRAPP
jgi:hypothetical protein